MKFPPPYLFLFPVDLLEEYNDEISINDEFEHEIFNKILNNDNTD